jgi:hypothetical protein
MLLTNEETEDIVRLTTAGGWQTFTDLMRFARAVEAKIIEKQKQQEPVAYIDANQGFMRCGNAADGLPIGTKLYAAPVHLGKPVAYLYTVDAYGIEEGVFGHPDGYYPKDAIPLYKLPEVK